MKTLDKNSLEDVFLNVRKSYRLLFDYQQKLLNLVKFIGNYFSYSYQGGWPFFSSPCPRRGRGKLENWAWDWLNMYAYAFNFGSKKNDNNEIFFEVRIYSDTGFYDEDDSERKKHQLDIDTYRDVNESKTQLVLIASNLGWDPNKLLKNFKSTKIEYCLKDGNNHICAKSYELSEFINEEATKNVLNNFVEYCKNNDIEIMSENQQKNI